MTQPLDDSVNINLFDDGGTSRQVVELETQVRPSDYDPGNSTDDKVSYHGGPSVSQADYDTPAAGPDPWTFEEVHPELQYTRGAPERKPLAVSTRLSRTFISRQYTLNPGTDPVQIVAMETRRSALTFVSSSATGFLVIGPEPGALIGGQGFVLPNNVPIDFYSFDSVFAIAQTAVCVISILEYIDD